MKASQRAVFIELTNEGGWSLCTFCKYDKGNACGGVDCKHPLNYRLSEDGLCPGEDCWAFRPCCPVSMCADIVGIVLSKGWRNGAVWWEEEGIMRVAELVDY